MGSFNRHNINGFQGFLAAVIGRLVRMAPYAKSPLARLLGFVTFVLTDATVKARYAAIGKLDTAMLDEEGASADRSVGVEHAFWKRVYSDRGFRAVDTVAFVAAAGDGEEPDGLGVRTSERPTLRTLPSVNAELLARLQSGEFSIETPKISSLPEERCEPNVQIVEVVAVPADTAPVLAQADLSAPAVVMRPSVPVGKDADTSIRSRKSTSGTHLGLAPIVLTAEQLATLHAQPARDSQERVESART